MDIVVVGAGSWGTTALACVLCETSTKSPCGVVTRRRCPKRKRRGKTAAICRVSGSLIRCGFTADLHAAIATLPKDEPSLIVAVVPTHTMRQVFADIAAEIPAQNHRDRQQGNRKRHPLTMDDVLSQVLLSHLHDRIAVPSAQALPKKRSKNTQLPSWPPPNNVRLRKRCSAPSGWLFPRLYIGRCHRG